MNTNGFLLVLGTTCKRFGPGQLPRAERRDIGAGYALASAATGATLIFALISWSLHALGSPIGSDWEILGAMALVSLPLVAPTSFISAVVIWRVLPSNTPHFGATAGVVTTLGTYILALLVLFAFIMIALVFNGQYTEIPEALGFLSVIGFVALGSTFWLTFPIGAISGIIHERVNLNRTKQA